MIASFNFEHKKQSLKTKRIGLRYGKTGIPVFLITYPNAKLGIEHYEYDCHLKSKLKGATDSLEEFAWKSVETFFVSGGEKAWVITTPWISRRNRRNETLIFDSLIGKYLGFRQNTGIQKLTEIFDVADMVVVPQAALILNQSLWVTFYQKLSEKISDSSCIGFVDFPREMDDLTIKKNVKKVSSSRLVANTPWVFHDEGCFPPSVVAAAAAQWADSKINMADSPANIPLAKVQDREATPICPVKASMPSLIKDFNECGVNVLHKRQIGDVVFLGSRTTNAVEREDIAVNRRTFAVRRALEEICDAYIFNHQNPTIYENMEMAIENEMQKHIRIFDDAVKNPFQVKCYEKKTNNDSQVQVEFDVHLVGTNHRINLGLNLAV